MWPFKKKAIILSERKYIDYLPVGTIVRLYNDNQEYMIYRYLGNACMSFRYNDDSLKKSHIYNKKINEKNTYYCVDYGIVSYPDGVSSQLLCIMHEDIKEVIYLGYDDEYRKNILNDIDNWTKKGGKNE